jgi:endonuclease/exonuclease/phosphatase family metal-dependent hydrolase
VKHTLRFVTWNIHKGIGTDGRYRLDRTIEVLRSLDADVVCLQEVDENVPRSKGHSQARVLADALAYEHVALGLNVAVAGGHYGNCTLSRRPILESRNVDLTIPLKKRRSALVSKIEGLHGVPWTVANLHLGLAHFERKMQLKSLLRHLLPVVPADEPLVLAGDWNDWMNRLFRGVASRQGFHIARCADGRPAGLRTFPSGRPLAALDKILYREPLAVKHAACVTDARNASDHLPLLVELHLPSPSAARRAG